MAIIIYIIVENPKLVYLQTAILYIFFSLLKLDKVDPLVADPPHANSTTTLLINTPLVMENLILFAYTAQRSTTTNKRHPRETRRWLKWVLVEKSISPSAQICAAIEGEFWISNIHSPPISLESYLVQLVSYAAMEWAVRRALSVGNL